MDKFENLIQEKELKEIVNGSIAQLLSEYGINSSLHSTRHLLEVDDPQEKASDVESEKQETAQVPEKQTTKKSRKITPESAIKLLNDVRSGKSIKDPEIKKQFVEYFTNLDIPARTALVGFLEGLKDIMVAGEPAATADDPSDDISMEPITEPESSQEPADSGSQEDSPPIKVGEPQTESAKILAKQLMIS